MKEELIFDIIDGTASAEAIQLHEKYLREDEGYRLLFQELLLTDDLLAESIGLEKTAVNFTDKLLDKWALAQQPEVLVTSTFSQRLPLYFLWGMVVLLVCCVALTMGSKGTGSTSVINVSLPTINTDIFNSKMVVNALLLINSLLLLYVVDRKWLRPYFGRKLY